MNQSSQRIWCYKCEMEVFLADMYIYGGAKVNHRRHAVTIDDNDTDDIDVHRLSSGDVTRYAEKFLSNAANVNILNSLGNSIMGGNEFSYGLTTNGLSANAGDYDSSADDDCDPDSINYNNSGGLVGLKNMTNTCYMNAALQALSNTPPLTGYFLECGDIIEENSKQTTPGQRKTGLAKSYYRLVKDMWLRPKGPNGKYGEQNSIYFIECI